MKDNKLRYIYRRIRLLILSFQNLLYFDHNFTYRKVVVSNINEIQFCHDELTNEGYDRFTDYKANYSEVSCWYRKKLKKGIKK